MKLTEEGVPVGARTERDVLVRVAFVTVLTAMLLVALNWALNVTNANARQVSHNLTHIQNGMDRATSDPSQSRSGTFSSEAHEGYSSQTASGPILEPVESGR